MENIDEILEKYFEGESSLEEEKILRYYFRQPDIEERHKIYAPMFDFFSGEKKEAPIEKRKKKIPLYYVWAGIAASLLIIVGIKSIYDTPIENRATKSLVYINGKKTTNIQTINSEALISIENISEVDKDVLDSQIGILESFTE